MQCCYNPLHYFAHMSQVFTSARPPMSEKGSILWTASISLTTLSPTSDTLGSSQMVSGEIWRDSPNKPLGFAGADLEFGSFTHMCHKPHPL